MSTGYYQKNKRKSSKEGSYKISKSFCRRKSKSINMVVNDIEIFLKMKNKGLLSIEKIILKYKELITG